MSTRRWISGDHAVSLRKRCAAVLIPLVVVSVGVSSSMIRADNVGSVSDAPAYSSLQLAERTTPPPPRPAPPESPVSSAQLDARMQEIFDMTNAERVKVGLRPLIRHDNLDESARSHALDQRNQPCEIGYLTHEGSDGTHSRDRIVRTGLSVRNWAENIACGFAGVDGVMTGWMNSAGHRANILNPALTHIGISVVFSDIGRYYWVQDFAVPRY